MAIINKIGFIKITLFILFSAFVLTGEIHAETSFIFNLDNAQTGTNSTTTGFGALVVNEEQGTAVLRMRFMSDLSSQYDLESGVQIRDENDEFLGYVSMQTERVSFLNDYSISSSFFTKLKQGKIRVIAKTQNFPNGEISGTIQPYSHYAGRVSGSLVFSGGNPNTDGFASVIVNQDESWILHYYRFSGLPPSGNLVTLDGTVIEASAGSSALGLDFIRLTTLSPTFISQMKSRGVVFSISNSGTQARGIVKRINKDVDFNGDTRADYAVFRPSEGNWYSINSVSQAVSVVKFGVNGDIPVPSDFDGDGVTDYAVWRPSNGVFYVQNAKTGEFKAVQWGINGDTPLTGDFDGDGKSDFVIYRPGAGNSQSGFWILKSTGGYSVTPFGLGDDKPLIADFDGDRVNDLTVWRPSNGTFYSLNSSNGAIRYQQWGVASDKVMARDFDGDGISDYLAYRNVLNIRTWYILYSSSGFTTYTSELWGNAFAQIQAADFTGDGKADFTNYLNGGWMVRDSLDSSIKNVSFGLSTDKPLQGN